MQKMPLLAPRVLHLPSIRAARRPRCASTRGILVAFAVAGAADAALAGSALTFRPVALGGDQAPGVEPAAEFFHTLFETSFPNVPRIDDDGNVSFHAYLTGPGISSAFGGNGITTWIDHPDKGGLELVARQSLPAPGVAAGQVFEGFTSVLTPNAPSMSGGMVSFVGSLRGPGIIFGQTNNVFGVWSTATGSLSLLARAGAQAPGTPAGVVFGGLQQQPEITGSNPFVTSRINSAGHTLQGAFLTGAGVTVDNNEGLWSNRSGTFELVLREGVPAPGTPPGVVFGAAPDSLSPGGLRQFSWNDHSRFALFGNVTGPGIDFFLNNDGIWVETDQGLELVALEAQSAPGTPWTFGVPAPGAVSDTFGGLGINNDGKVAFTARLSPDSGDAGFSTLWSTRSGSLQMEIGPGINPPGVPADDVGGLLSYSLANTNKLAFIRALAPDPGEVVSDNFGLWSDASGALQLIVKTGDPASQFGPGITFGALIEGDGRDFMRLTDSGWIGFRTNLAGPGIAELNGLAYFLADPEGNLHLVLHRGDLFDVGALNGGQPGRDLRQIIDILVGGMNNHGEWSFKIVFDDGSIAIFTARLADETANPADLDGDGDVDGFDLALLLGQWTGAAMYTPCAPIKPADLNFDCKINGFDLAILLGAWG